MSGTTRLVIALIAIIGVLTCDGGKDRSMTLPTLTRQQRSAALAKAAEARVRRAQVKAALKRGSLSLPEFFDAAAQDDALGRMRAMDLLQALPRVGATTAKALMEEVGISPARRVRGLGARQRAALIARLG